MRWTGLLVPRLALIALTFGLLVLGAATLLDPPGRLATHNPSIHVALDVVESMIALLIAYLMVARVRDRGLASDLLSLYALAVLGLTKIALLAIPTVSAGTRGDLELWAAPFGRVVGSTALALAALIGTRTVHSPITKVKRAVVAAVATVAVIAIASWLVKGATAADPADPFVLRFHALTAIALAVASLGFVHRASQEQDELLTWFGAGCALGAVARLGYVFFPVHGVDDVYVQDFLRLAFYVLLVVGAQREALLYWRSRAEAAGLEERRRIARDLHDGLAQELVFISGQVKRLQRGDRGPELEQLSSAADRAVSEARRAITVLTQPGVQSLSDALQDLADEFGARYPVIVELVLDRAVDLSPTMREEVLRIVREAMNNAVRHGGAQVIRVKTWDEGGARLEVRDDGFGFDAENGGKREGGFGLISMRERAEAVGGQFEIESHRGRGTTVRVRLPSR